MQSPRPAQGDHLMALKMARSSQTPDRQRSHGPTTRVLHPASVNSPHAGPGAAGVNGYPCIVCKPHVSHGRKSESSEPLWYRETSFIGSMGWPPDTRSCLSDPGRPWSTVQQARSRVVQSSRIPLSTGQSFFSTLGRNQPEQQALVSRSCREIKWTPRPSTSVEGWARYATRSCPNCPAKPASI